MSEEKPEAKYRPDEVLDYISDKGWAYELDRREENYKIQMCPFCGNDRWNFEMHIGKGIFSCWACEEKGGFLKLKEKMGDVAPVKPYSGSTRDKTTGKRERAEGSKALDTTALTENVEGIHQKIWERPTALEYLRGRGFNDETIAHFKLGSVKQDGKRWLVIPHYTGESVCNIKYRSMPPGETEWKSQPGGAKVLFNGNAVKGADSIIICEGELKAAACWQVGFKNVVALTAGVRNFYPHWIDQLDGLKKIFLCLDSDVEGQRNAEVLANRLGLDRTYNVVLPDAKDPDEFFFVKGHDELDFQRLMDSAKQYDVKNIISVQDALWHLSDTLGGRLEQKEALLTQWPEINKLTKGFRPGELIIFSAPPKIGKTTWALDLSLWHVQREVPVLFYCMEMSPDRLARKVTANILQIEDDYIDEDLAAETALQLMGRPFYLPEHVRTADLQMVLDTMRAAYKRYGIQLIIFDNLHFLVRDADKLREKLGMASQAFKMLAEELRIPIILVVHPRKIQNKRIMTSNDLRDTSTIHADADMVIILHRKRVDDGQDGDGDPDETADTAIFESETQVIVDAARYAPGGKTVLFYEGAESRFRSLSMEDRLGYSPSGGGGGLTIAPKTKTQEPVGDEEITDEG